MYYMERTLERINTNLNSRLFHGHTFYCGTVLNLSEKGVFVWSRGSVPVNNIFVLLVHIKHELILVILRVRWVIKTEGFFNGMGAEILNPKEDYLRLLEALRHQRSSDMILKEPKVKKNTENSVLRLFY